MPINDLRHFVIREKDARALAQDAASPAARDFHLKTACQYASLAEAARRGIAISQGMSQAAPEIHL